jgi:hypothetical protein
MHAAITRPAIAPIISYPAWTSASSWDCCRRRSGNRQGSSCIPSDVVELHDAIFRLNSVRNARSIVFSLADMNDPDADKRFYPTPGHRSGCCARFERPDREIGGTGQGINCRSVHSYNLIRSCRVARSGSCLSRQSALYPVIPGNSRVFLNGVRHSGQVGIASPVFNQT